MPERIENRMVVDSQWPAAAPDIAEKINGPGYAEIGTGNFVPEEEAYTYALERIYADGDLRKEFVEWFYSGNWVFENGK